MDFGSALGSAVGSIGSAFIQGKTQDKISNRASDVSREAIKSQETINAQQLAWSKEQQQWQEKMSNTQYQRQVDDMLKAGINPILAATKGGGAAMPAAIPLNLGNPSDAGARAYGAVSQGMSAATSAAASKFNAIKDIGKLGAETYKTLKEAQRVESETRKTEEQIKTIPVARTLTTQQIKRVSHEIANLKQQWYLLKAQTKLNRANTAQSINRGEGIRYDNAKKEVVANFIYSGKFAELSTSLGEKTQVKKLIEIFNDVFQMDVSEFMPRGK